MKILTDFKTIKNSSVYEETEKRSRFISYSFCVNSQEDVCKYLEKVKFLHPSAKHHVYAYILNNSSEKYCDDGEPAGTGGMPILNSIKSMELKNTLVIIVRYFGGILLGTNGLRKMYSSGAKNVLAISGQALMAQCVHATICTDYSNYNKILAIISDYNAKIVNSIFEQKINLEFYIKKDYYETFKGKITNLLKNSNKLKFLEEDYQVL